MTRKTLVAIPTRGNDLSLNLVTFISKIKYDIYFSQCNFSAALAQENCFNVAYDKGCNVIMMDSDVSTSNETLEKLINSGKEVICAPVIHYDIFKKEIHVDACPDGPRNFCFKTIGMETIKHSSFSCLFVSYDVLKAFKDNKELFTEFSVHMDRPKEYVTSDQIFFEKLQLMDIPAWVNWECQDTIHHRTVDLSLLAIKRLFHNLVIF
jgi:hypothetical protein